MSLPSVGLGEARVGGAIGDRALGQDGPGPLAVAWRDRYKLLVIAMVAAGLTYVLSSRATPVYAAETTLAFPYTNSEVALPGGDAERSRSLRTEAERIRSLELLTEAAAEVGDGFDADMLERQVEALPASNADVITVRAVAETPRHAVAIADAVAAAYRRQVDQRQRRAMEDLKQRRRKLEQRIGRQQTRLAAQLQRAALDGSNEQGVEGDPSIASARLALEASVAQLSDVQQRLDELVAELDSAVGRIQILRPAKLPAEREQPRPLRDAATVVLLALLTVVTVRWWRADPEPPSVSDPHTAAALLGVPVIAEVPAIGQPSHAAGVVVADFPHVIDAYRMVAASSPMRGAVLMTGTRPEESCTDLVLNMGVELSRDGYRVVLVEGDPKLSRMRASRSTDERGLTDIVHGRAAIDDCLLVGASEANAGVALLPWGGGSSGIRGAGSGLGRTIAELTTIADLILIDGPPLVSSADAVSLAASADATILVVTLGTAVADLSRLRARLAQLDGPVLGIVFQHTADRRPIRRRQRRVTAPVRWAPRARAGTAVAES